MGFMLIFIAIIFFSLGILSKRIPLIFKDGLPL